MKRQFDMIYTAGGISTELFVPINSKL